jgi:hypothetical protein
MAVMTTSFQKDILPLFTETDIDHMKGTDNPVYLDDYDYMKDPDHARSVYHKVSTGQMPPSEYGGPWPEDKVTLFKTWMDGGYAP